MGGMHVPRSNQRNNLVDEIVTPHQAIMSIATPPVVNHNRTYKTAAVKIQFIKLFQAAERELTLCQ